jgi:hypothetical protein
LNFLDKSSREAVREQKTFALEKDFKKVKLSIESRVLVFSLRQVVGVLANQYPYMFLDDPMLTVQGITVRPFRGKGTGGVTGVSSLPKALQQKFTRMLDVKHGVVKKKKRKLPDENSERRVPTKKRKVYGVQGEKFYLTGTDQLE